MNFRIGRVKFTKAPPNCCFLKDGCIIVLEVKMLDSSSKKATNIDKPKLRSYFDIENNVEYVNLGPYLDSSFQEYQYYVTENELHTLKQKEKNQLGTHFILNQILIICRMSKRKKCFYYELNEDYAVERLLIERIFKVLHQRLSMMISLLRSLLLSNESFKLIHLSIQVR